MEWMLLAVTYSQSFCYIFRVADLRHISQRLCLVYRRLLSSPFGGAHGGFGQVKTLEFRCPCPFYAGIKRLK